MQLNMAREGISRHLPPKKKNYPARADENIEVNRCSSKLREGGATLDNTEGALSEKAGVEHPAMPKILI